MMKPEKTEETKAIAHRKERLNLGSCILFLFCVINVLCSYC